jgi:thiamine kinase-like enzyme
MEFIANGTQAELYKDNDMAIKLFKKNVSKGEVEYEINLQKMAFGLGLPVPKIYDMIEIDGKYGILMEYIAGVPIGEAVFKDQNKFQEYLIKSIEIQINLNNIIANTFPSMKEILIRNINHVSEIEITYKQEILDKLEKICFNNFLCHGDFHFNNLLETSNGIKIIDWVNSSTGNFEADICRTYLLYKMNNEVLAELFIENYCERTKVPKENIMNWLPFVAAARLTEGRDRQENEILKKIIKENI